MGFLMVNVTEHPVIVDGVRLDTLAWGIEAAKYSVGGLRDADLALPGVDGVVPSLYDPREPGRLVLSMFVQGTDADGTVPTGADRVAVLRENLDTLLGLFGRTDRLLEVREVIDTTKAGDAGQRIAWCKVQDSMEPDMEPGTVARFKVSMTIPAAYWRSAEHPTWTQPAVVIGDDYTVDTLTGSSGPILDAVVVLTGPIAGPSITDVATGHTVSLGASLAAGESWRVNVATWETRTGTLGVGSADTTGTSRAGVTETVGALPHLLPLRPVPVAGQRVVRVRVGGSGATADTTLSIKARRTYL